MRESTGFFDYGFSKISGGIIRQPMPFLPVAVLIIECDFGRLAGHIGKISEPDFFFCPVRIDMTYRQNI